MCIGEEQPGGGGGGGDSRPPQPPQYSAPPNPGKIADYDPLHGGGSVPRNSPYSARQSATVIYTSERGAGSSLHNWHVSIHNNKAMLFFLICLVTLRTVSI